MYSKDIEISLDLNKQNVDTEVTVQRQQAVTAELALSTGGSNDHNKLKNRDLENQHPISAITDLSEKLDTKQDKGDYALKSEIPIIPTDISAFNNDVGYLTEHQDISNLATKEELSNKQDKGNYALKSEIPTKTPQLTNDSNFITSSYHDSTKQDKLTAGDNITIVNNVISATGGGGSAEDTSKSLSLISNFGVLYRSGGICTSKNYYNFSNAFVINIICKRLKTGNIYSGGDYFKLQKDDKNYFTFNITAYELKLKLVKNGEVVNQIDFIRNGDVYTAVEKCTDYIMTLDYANKKFVIKTREYPSTYKTALVQDLSDFDLDSLGDFQIVTELGCEYSVNTASKFVILNQYLSSELYLGQEISSDNYSPFSMDTYGSQCLTDNFEIKLGGTRLETITSSHVINSFSMETSNYFAMGIYNPNMKTLGFTMITKVRFPEITSPVQIAAGAGVNNISVYDEDYNLVGQASGALQNLLSPEVNKWYYFQAESDASSTLAQIGYVANYGYRLVGAGTIELMPIAVCYARKGNIGSINWNGKYFTGDVPFTGTNIKFQQFTSNDFSRIPLYQQKIENGNIYMYNGTTWKQISS